MSAAATQTTAPHKWGRGDKVSFKGKGGAVVKGTVKRQISTGELVINGADGGRYSRTPKEVVLIGAAADDVDDLEAIAPNGKKGLPPVSDAIKAFDINKRFDYLAQIVRMVISGTAVSAIITGEGGLGKTYTVNRELMRKKLVKGDDYHIVKGFTTPKGLYRTLFENNGKIVIFDDCDEALEDKIAKNILKGALDSYDVREISWITHMSDDSGLPDSFEFTGQCIFISNMGKDDIEQALISRSLSVDVTMSAEEKVERMEFIIKSPDFMPVYKMQMKQDAVQIIKDNLADVRELSLRSVEKVVKVLAGDKDLLDTTDPDFQTLDLKEMARFLLLS